MKERPWLAAVRTVRYTAHVTDRTQHEKEFASRAKLIQIERFYVFLFLSVMAMQKLASCTPDLVYLRHWCRFKASRVASTVVRPISLLTSAAMLSTQRSFDLPVCLVPSSLAQRAVLSIWSKYSANVWSGFCWQCTIRCLVLLGVQISDAISSRVTGVTNQPGHTAYRIRQSGELEWLPRSLIFCRYDQNSDLQGHLYSRFTYCKSCRTECFVSRHQRQDFSWHNALALWYLTLSGLIVCTECKDAAKCYRCS